MNDLSAWAKGIFPIVVGFLLGAFIWDSLIAAWARTKAWTTKKRRVVTLVVPPLVFCAGLPFLFLLPVALGVHDGQCAPILNEDATYPCTLGQKLIHGFLSLNLFLTPMAILSVLAILACWAVAWGIRRAKKESS